MDSAKCSIPCNLCGSVEVVELSLVDRNNGFLRTVMCRKCGLAWSDPRPNEDEIKLFYSKNYRVAYKGTYKPLLKHVYRAGETAERRYEFIADVVKSGDRVLDIGAGGGEFVFLLRNLGIDASGIEPNEGYGNYAKNELGMPIEIGFVQQMELASESLDAITMHHVFEHLDDPFAILRIIHRALKTEGIAVIDVPNIEGTCCAPNHRFHQAHLYNFNPANLEMIGRRAGFEVVRTEVSEDGGVVRTIFRKSEMTEDFDAEIPGNFERVYEIIRGHTEFSHYLTANPYVRPFRKLKMNLREMLAIRGSKDGKDVLEKLVKSAGASG